MNCDVTKCKAACCYNAPLDKGLISARRNRIVNPIIRLEVQFGNMVIPITNEDREKNKCPFLTAKCKCNVYQWRPQLCRLYGQRPDIAYLRCGFLMGENVQSVQIKDMSVDSAQAQVLLNLHELGYSESLHKALNG